MKWIVYYAVTIILNIASIILFSNKINITANSAVPILILAFTLLQVYLLKTMKPEKGFRTNYSRMRLTEKEESELFDYLAISSLICIPFFIPEILFFSSGVKEIISLAVWFIGFISGAIVYRIKCKDKIYGRIKAENEELNKQKQKEELGKWK